ncbi:unnamed protein product [Somion occarium]
MAWGSSPGHAGPQLHVYKDLSPHSAFVHGLVLPTMSVMSVDIALGAICLFTLGLWAYLSRTMRDRLRQPPGPPGLPLIGNLKDMPSDEAWLTYIKWSQQYDSGMIRLNVFGTNMIVVNSLEIAVDLFDRRSSIYNDRPRLIMLNELSGFGWGAAFTPYSDFWRAIRKAFHQTIGPENMKRWIDVETRASHHLLRNLHESPDSFAKHIRHFSGEVIMRLAYGMDVQQEDDPYIDIAERGTHAISATTNAGSYLVDVIPILKYVPEWFPGAKFKREAKAWRMLATAMLNQPFDFVKKQLELGDLPLCAASLLLDRMDNEAQDRLDVESVLKSTLGSMYAAGADTTVSTLLSFILAMVLHPEIQKKAHKEVDQILGARRLPSFSDRHALPYIDAIVNECLRWHPVIPLSVPHRLMQDDEYKGYFLPKGSLLIPNSWAILHDENVYPNPLIFNPDRFLKDGVRNPDVPDPEVSFGFGRRLCPGRFMAKESLWIAIASLLATFEFRKSIGPDGSPITPEEEYIPGFLSHPKPFPCDIRPRSEERVALILTNESDA